MYVCVCVCVWQEFAEFGLVVVQNVKVEWSILKTAPDMKAKTKQQREVTNFYFCEYV